MQVSGSTVTLFSSDGKKVTSAAVKGQLGGASRRVEVAHWLSRRCSLPAIGDGAELCVGNWDVEVAQPLAREAYYNGTAFGAGNLATGFGAGVVSVVSAGWSVVCVAGAAGAE